MFSLLTPLVFLVHVLIGIGRCQTFIRDSDGYPTTWWVNHLKPGLTLSWVPRRATNSSASIHAHTHARTHARTHPPTYAHKSWVLIFLPRHMQYIKLWSLQAVEPWLLCPAAPPPRASLVLGNLPMVPCTLGGALSLPRSTLA